MRNSSFLSLLAIVFVLLFACSSETRQVEQKKEQGGIRIVSFSPGITNTIIDSGYGESIVGRSAFCFHADQSIPVVGDLRTIDYERLLKLAPTHVFVQETAADVDEHLRSLASSGAFKINVCPIDRIDEIELLYGDIAELFGKTRGALGFTDPIEIQLPSPVLIITQGIEGNAGLSFGKDTYMDDILQTIHVQNIVEKSGWISLSLEDIGRLKPKAIIVVSDSKMNDSSLVSLRSLGFPVIPFVHKHVLVPSSYVVDVARELQRLPYTQ